MACLDRSLGRILAELELRGRPERVILHLAGDNEHTELHARILGHAEWGRKAA